MNTIITIVVAQAPGESTVDISDAIEAGFGEFDRVVKKFTRFNQDSELSNMNRNSGKWTNVSEELFMLVSRMLELSKATDGAFDPTIIDFLETYGYDPNYDFSKLDKPDLDKLVKKIASERKSWRDVELDSNNFGIKLAEGQRIDLGGIGKGYAIDLAMEKLKDFKNVLVDGGGDIRVKGVNEDGEPWKLGLKHKAAGQDTPTIIGQITSTDLALASSGSWARKVKQFHHIINPATGEPADNLQTVFVTAPDATLADSWATALFVGGKELLTRLPEGMSAMLIDKENKAAVSTNFPEFTF
jgi:thiamine biosynthesis lipoprotein